MRPRASRSAGCPGSAPSPAGHSARRTSHTPLHLFWSSCPAKAGQRADLGASVVDAESAGFSGKSWEGSQSYTGGGSTHIGVRPKSPGWI